MRTSFLRKLLLVATLLAGVTNAPAQNTARKDFDFYWQTINDNFAYFAKQKTDWDKVKNSYAAIADTVSSRSSMIKLLEQTNNELHNGHVFLNTNLPSSNRLVPSGSDMKAVFENGKYVITEIRPGFNANTCGLKVGMTVISVNGIPVNDAIKKLIPKFVSAPDDAVYDYAANVLLAGTHEKERLITTFANGIQQEFHPDSIPNKTEKHEGGLLTENILPGNIGYIKINNSLGDDDLITAFDHALDSVLPTNALVLDLRETPGGGTTTVARAIMGRFTKKELPYQKHIYTAEEKETGIRRATLELVSPRGTTYEKPLLVLVSYWTGSMGEGMAIGFDGMKCGMIAGTKMAGLLGEIYSFETPGYKIPFSFPCVQLQHVNGLPREDFVPPAFIENDDRAPAVAAEILRKKLRE